MAALQGNKYPLLAKREMIQLSYPTMCIKKDETVTQTIYEQIKKAIPLVERVRKFDWQITHFFVAMRPVVSDAYFASLTDQYARFLVAKGERMEDFQKFVSGSLHEALLHGNAGGINESSIQKSMLLTLVDQMQQSLQELRYFRQRAPNHRGLRALCAVETTSQGVQRMMDTAENSKVEMQQFKVTHERTLTEATEKAKVAHNLLKVKEATIVQLEADKAAAEKEYQRRQDAWRNQARQKVLDAHTKIVATKEKEHKQKVAKFKANEQGLKARVQKLEAALKSNRTERGANLVAATKKLQAAHGKELEKQRVHMAKQFEARLKAEKLSWELSLEKNCVDVDGMVFRETKRKAEKMTDEDKSKEASMLPKKRLAQTHAMSTLIRNHLIFHQRLDPSKAQRHIQQGHLPHNAKAYAEGKDLRWILTGDGTRHERITSVQEYWELLFDERAFEGPVRHAFHLLYTMQANARSISAKEWSNFVTCEIQNSGEILRESCSTVAKKYLRTQGEGEDAYVLGGQADIPAFLAWVQGHPRLSQELANMIAKETQRKPKRRKCSFDADAKMAACAADAMP